MPSLPTEINQNTLYSQKKALRAYYIQKRKDLGHDNRRSISNSLTKYLCDLPCFKHCDTLLCYYPIGEEIDTLNIANTALKMGKTLAFPISDTATHTLSFHSVSSIDDMNIGAYHIHEPSLLAPSITDFSNSLCIVPALVFDRSGHRLGYGKGFYDRFLERFDGISIGLAYSPFVLETLPHDRYDKAVDIIITEKGEIYNARTILK